MVVVVRILSNVHPSIGPTQTPGGREHSSARRSHPMISAATRVLVLQISIRIQRKLSSVLPYSNGLKRRRNSANLARQGCLRFTSVPVGCPL